MVRIPRWPYVNLFSDSNSYSGLQTYEDLISERGLDDPASKQKQDLRKVSMLDTVRPRFFIRHSVKRSRRGVVCLRARSERGDLSYYMDAT